MNSWRKGLLLTAVLLLVPGLAATAAEPFFSEYVEGSSYNKAVEIYNATGFAVNLGGYQLEVYYNGATTPLNVLTLPAVSLANGDVYVVAHTQASTALTALADLVWAGLAFNGDDAVVLRKVADSSVADAIGQVGTDPGSEWGSGLTSTADNTMRRKLAVCAGDMNPSDAYDPAVEWDGYVADTFEGLGVHVSNCEPVPNDATSWGALKSAYR
jgi:hypothetical protein